ncbi:MAG TPA: phage/plasmid primase, P4 family [Chthoniobacterales bacterium]
MPDLWRVLGLPGVPKKVMRSPFREDRNESFSVFERDGRWFFKDHAVDEHHGDEVTLIELARSISNREAITLYHSLAGVASSRGGGSPAEAGSKPVRRKNRATVAEEKKPEKPRDTSIQPEWARTLRFEQGGRCYVISTIYDYLDSDGEVLHQTVRFQWESEDGEKRDKTFRQRRKPKPGERPAVDGWVYFLDGIEPVLYRLPEIEAAGEGEPIFLVEGEKDADTLKELGLLSTTVPMGAGKWRDSYLRTLKGKWVVVLGDNDDAGRNHVNKVCKALREACGRLGAVYLAEKWPECPDKADITDWLGFLDERPDVVGLGDSCEAEEVRDAAYLALKAWAETARPPEEIRYSHCFSYGDRGGLKVHQDELAGVLSEEFVARYAGEEWWQWERTRWRRLDVQREPRRWIMAALRSHLDARKEMTSYLVNSIEDLMANRVAMHVDRFNSHDADLINCANGMLHMRDLTLTPHNPKYLSTVQIPHAYEGEAECPRFKAWLEQMLPAADVQRQVQEIFGYCLAPQLNYHKFFFFYGDGGTGKSTLIEVLTKLIGEDNSMALRLQELDNPFQRAQLVGKRLYLATELNRDSFKHIDLIKAITSGEQIGVDVKHKAGYSYRPQGRFIMASNVRASTSDTSDGFFRRLCQVTFENKIPEDQKDYSLVAKFEAEMSGILRWALEGLHRLMERGHFEQTADSARAAKEIQMHRSSAKAFWEACVELVDSADSAKVYLTVEQLFAEYKEWCEWEGVKPHFQDSDSLSREFINKMPHLKEFKKKASIWFEGCRKQPMSYFGFHFRNWRPQGASE